MTPEVTMQQSSWFMLHLTVFTYLAAPRAKQAGIFSWYPVAWQYPSVVDQGQAYHCTHTSAHILFPVVNFLDNFPIDMTLSVYQAQLDTVKC